MWAISSKFIIIPLYTMLKFHIFRLYNYKIKDNEVDNNSVTFTLHKR